MKKIFLFLLIILPVYLSISIYFLDKYYFLCPIKYQRDILTRCDTRGDGLFSTPRNGNRLHQGIDLLVEVGRPVFVSRSGRVVVAQQTAGMGKYIIVRHQGNITTLYGHLSEICVSKGRFVCQGEIIGRSGKTGNANFADILPHLHFEVRRAGVPQDPLIYLE